MQHPLETPPSQRRHPRPDGEEAAAPPMLAEGSVVLPGDAEQPFRQRLNAQRAAQGKEGAVVALALGLAGLARCWSLSTLLMRCYLVAYSSAAATTLVWQRLHRASYARWLEVSAALLALSSSGLGQSWLQMRRLLDAYPLPDPPTASDPAPTLGDVALGTARHALLLLFASNAVAMAALCLLLSQRMRISLALVVFVAVTAIALPYGGLLCDAPCLTHPAARAAQAHLYAALSLFSYALPLPVAPWVLADAPAMCTTLLRFSQLALGTGLPLLAATLAEARAWQLHAQQRWRAGLPAQHGVHAVLYDWITWLTMGGGSVHTVLLAWLLLACVWDWTAFFSVPASQRQCSWAD